MCLERISIFLLCKIKVITKKSEMTSLIVTFLSLSRNHRGHIGNCLERSTFRNFFTNVSLSCWVKVPAMTLSVMSLYIELIVSCLQVSVNECGSDSADPTVPFNLKSFSKGGATYASIITGRQ
jgi:hypothetical protein